VTAPKEKARPTLRIGDLAEQSGVPIATIKYYIREGLLPPPPMKTGRTMAYYDEDYLEQLRVVRRLREEHFLPVRVIKTILEERGAAPLDAHARALVLSAGPGFLARVQAERAPAPPAADPNLTPDERTLLEDLGLLGGDADEDAELLGAMAAMEQAGLGRDRFPLEGLGHYVELLGELARRELRHFAQHAEGLDSATVETLAARAFALTAPLVAIIHKKLVLRTLRAELARKETP
jgi:DNA-binding transcriptional MerR regulator